VFCTVAGAADELVVGQEIITKHRHVENSPDMPQLIVAVQDDWVALELTYDQVMEHESTFALLGGKSTREKITRSITNWMPLQAIEIVDRRGQGEIQGTGPTHFPKVGETVAISYLDGNEVQQAFGELLEINGQSLKVNQARKEEMLRRTPILGQLPLIGEMFSERTFTTTYEEVTIAIDRVCTMSSRMPGWCTETTTTLAQEAQ
jgi:hypothetical protein